MPHPTDAGVLGIARNFFQYVADNLRLYAEEDNVRTVNGLLVLGRHRDAEFLGHRRGLFRVLHRCGNALGRKKFLFQVRTQ
jgi:hypothetical protein